VHFEWAEAKARSNRLKHGVDFADAASVLADELAITIADEELEEERYVTIGMDALGRLLVGVYTLRDDRIRLLSARRATRRERGEYKTRLI